MAQVKFIATVKAKIDSIPKEPGNIIFSTDDRVVYLDKASDKRISFQEIMTIATESEREVYTGAVNGGFYYVTETHLLYRYSNDEKWICLNKAGSGNVIFDDRGSFPEKGDPTALYVTDDSIYKWSDSSNDYIKVGAGSLDSALTWGKIK